MQHVLRFVKPLNHYIRPTLKGQTIQTGKGNENGDVEQRHHRLKQAVKQSLLLRGSQNFSDRQGYDAFLRQVFSQLNAGRRARLVEEVALLRSLPLKRLDDCPRFHVKVGPSSTIRIQKNVYSVHSRLIGERIEVRLSADELEIWYAQKKRETIPRLRGCGKHHIQYRHIIEWLKRKPGAFENYRYRSDLFPSSHFRMAYDRLMAQSPTRAHKEYLSILYLAARETESGVEAALKSLLDTDASISVAGVERGLAAHTPSARSPDVTIAEVDASAYDCLLEQGATIVGASAVRMQDAYALNEIDMNAEGFTLQEGPCCHRFQHDSLAEML